MKDFMDKYYDRYGTYPEKKNIKACISNLKGFMDFLIEKYL
jgi:hypothetical protein